jgi:pentatricopeptide repeat protein
MKIHQKNSEAQRLARLENLKKARKVWNEMSKEERSKKMPKTASLKKARLANIKIAQSKRWIKK